MLDGNNGCCVFQCAVPCLFEVDGPFRERLFRLAAEFMDATAQCKERQEGKPFPFHSDRYRAMFGGSGNEVIKEAERIGLIERSKGWLAGKTAKLTRLADRYRDGRFRVVTSQSKQRSKQHLASPGSLGEVRAWIVSHQSRFTLPDSPICHNAWTDTSLFVSPTASG